MDKSIDLKDKECKLHSMPIHSICSYESCEEKHLCDICVNVHNKDHKFLISINSIKNNIFESLIEKNEEKSKKNEEFINITFEEYQKKIESDINIFKEYVFNRIEESKNSLFEWLENHRKSQLEESNIWTKIKFEYGKSYMDYISKDHYSEISGDSRPLNQNLFLNLNDNFSSMLDNSFKEEDNSALKQLLNVINKIVEKQVHHFNYNSNVNNLMNINAQNNLIGDLNLKILDQINHTMCDLRTELKKTIDDKFFFSNRINELNLENEIIDSPKFFNKKQLNIIAKDEYRSTSPNLTRKRRSTSNSANKNIKKELNPNSNSFIEIGSVNKCNIPLNIIPEKIDLTSKDIFADKKGSWYSLEHIEDMNFMIIGYSTGEIVIFNESDLTLIRTFRPRFKRVRKIIYSQENSSIFACYDDGYLTVISMINFKITSYKISSNQIYTMDIMPNYNILIFGGVEKKILISYIINLSKVLLFHESKDGEIQCLLYDEKRDIIISGFRKQCLTFFEYKTNNVIYKHEFTKENCCPMIIKKHKEDFVITSGYFLNIEVFKLKENSVEHSFRIECGFLHLYDFFFLDENYLFISTFDENKLIIVDYKNKSFIKAFDNFKGIVQLKFINNYLYATSHNYPLRKIIFQ